MTTDDVKRKLAAILSADAKEYSCLMRDDETATVKILTDYREVMTTLLKKGAEEERRQRIRFYRHIQVYLSVIVFLLIINLLTYGGTLWFHWPALGWGLLLFLHWRPSFRSSYKWQDEIETEKKKRRMQPPTTGKEPRYLWIQVEPKDSERSRDEVVNIRIPIKILKTGVKLSAYLPEHAKERINDALKERGFSLDLLSFDDEKLDELLESLLEMRVDVDKDDKKVRIYCE